MDPSSANSYRRFPASFSVDFLLWVYGTELKPGGPTPRMRNFDSCVARTLSHP